MPNTIVHRRRSDGAWTTGPDDYMVHLRCKRCGHLLGEHPATIELSIKKRPPCRECGCWGYKCQSVKEQMAETVNCGKQCPELGPCILPLDHEAFYHHSVKLDGSCEVDWSTAIVQEEFRRVNPQASE